MNNPSPIFAAAHTVPLCLRHHGAASALEDAAGIAEFLQLACNNLLMLGDDGMPDRNMERATIGLSRCFELLRTKLAIAIGELAWPETALDNENAASLGEALCRMDKLSAR